MNVSDTDSSEIADYARQSGFTFPIGMDMADGNPHGVGTSYGVQATPSNYVIDKAGEVVFRGVGFDEGGIRGALAKLGVR